MAEVMKAVGTVDVGVMMAREVLHLNLRASTAVFEVVDLYLLVASLWMTISVA